MLKVPQKLEYAIRAMIDLTTHREEGVLVPAREIAERQQIPLRFLEQQLGALSRAGLVESFRGAGGGCRIAGDPADITIAQVADAIEGQIYPVFCLEPSDHTCFADSRCGLQGFWADVARAVQEGRDDLTGDLGALALVGRREGLVEEHHGPRGEVVDDVAHPAEFLVELPALHPGVLLPLEVR